MKNNSSSSNADEVSKSVLKAKMFEYFRNIEKTGRPLIVKDFNQPTLIISPYHSKQDVAELFADARAKAKINKEHILASEVEDWGEDL